MFGKFTAAKSNQAIQSLIGVGTVIVGDVNFSGGLRIDGAVQGNIKAAAGSHSMLVISEQAKIDGEIHAAHLVVNGTINGSVYATQLVELQPKARVKGDVIYNAIEMHHGAVVAGTLKHQAADAQLALPAPTPASTAQASFAQPAQSSSQQSKDTTDSTTTSKSGGNKKQ